MRKFWLLLAVILLAGCMTQRGFPPRITNFDKVNASLYRGGQPNTVGIEWLRGAGIKSIINLRMADDVWPGEPIAAAANGIQYTNIPLHGFSAPTRTEMEAILAAIEQMPPPVYLHCQLGCDRTGTAVACYRIRHGWSVRNALKEAAAYGMSIFECGMRRFIEHFK